MADPIEGKVAFVAGATGLTGRFVVEELRRRGARTVAHVRPDSSSLDAWRARFRAMGAEVDTTPWDEAAMLRTLRELAPDVVFALLGTTRARDKRARKQGSDSSYETVDYGMTSLLRRACERCGSRPRFVYLSAVGVSDASSNPYYQVRARIERELRDGPLPYVVARPSFILGERDESRPGETIGAGVGDTLLGIAGALGATRLRDRYRSIRAEDLARALVRLAFDPAADRTTIEPSGLR